jgi:hypothetical protein
MARKIKDYTGVRFVRLTVIEMLPTAIVSKAGVRFTACRAQCDCGAVVVRKMIFLVTGQVTSCGCLAREKKRIAKTTHGHHGTPEYIVWQGMLRRCDRPKHPSYANYGGRGIRVCDRWKTSFASFLEDMGPRPSDGHSLERKESSGNYEPGNVVWATRSEQSRNTRRNRHVTIAGVTKVEKDWAVEAGFRDAGPVAWRLQQGWDRERALTLPSQRRPAITSAQTAAIKAARAAGKSFKAIAAEMGIHHKTAWEHSRKPGPPEDPTPAPL